MARVFFILVIFLISTNANGARVNLGIREPGKSVIEASCGRVFGPSNFLLLHWEVASLIEQNKHLPDIPSSEEFKENGVGLGEMDNMLLRKIKELTLYMIALQKEVQDLRKFNNELCSKLQVVTN